MKTIRLHVKILHQYFVGLIFGPNRWNFWKIECFGSVKFRDGKKSKQFSKTRKSFKKGKSYAKPKKYQKNIEISCYFLVFNKFIKMFEENFQKNSKIY